MSDTTHWIEIRRPGEEKSEYLPCAKRPTKAQAIKRAAKIGEGTVALSIAYACPRCGGDMSRDCGTCNERGAVRDPIQPDEKP